MATLQRVTLDPESGIAILIADDASPATAAYQAPIGSIYISRTNGAIFRKTGTGTANWTAM
jgi:hypothetical protein